ISVITGFFVGFICVLLGGCPIRQTVMASEGNYKAAFFFLGMCIGSIIFAAYVSGWFTIFMRSIGFGG
ncbi:MAG TPA: transporter component, partial [Methanoregulaceae archaeon]|nr:transporter component [Methanoregulaceae archaeon]